MDEYNSYPENSNQYDESFNDYDNGQDYYDQSGNGYYDENQQYYSESDQGYYNDSHDGYYNEQGYDAQSQDGYYDEQGYDTQSQDGYYDEQGYDTQSQDGYYDNQGYDAQYQVYEQPQSDLNKHPNNLNGNISPNVQPQAKPITAAPETASSVLQPKTNITPKKEIEEPEKKTQPKKNKKEEPKQIATAQPVGYNPPPQGQQYYHQTVIVQNKTSDGRGVASFVLGLISWFCFTHIITSFIGLILGFASKKDAFAVLGIILNGINVLIWLGGFLLIAFGVISIASIPVIGSMA